MAMKSLSEMTLEELWHLFPIRLVEYRPEWVAQYEEERGVLSELLAGRKIVAINHIGSTAVGGIWAKPIVDILIEIDRGEVMKDVADVLVGNGYLCMNRSENRISLNKGYTERGYAERVFHIHLRYDGDNDEIFFRDFLISHPEDAKRYEELKLSLWKQYEFDRDGYTEAKSEFVGEIMGRRGG